MTSTDLDHHRGDDLPDAPSAGIQIHSDRAIQEVQAQATLAKRFPRNETTVFTAVMTACKRPALAEVSQYSYPRGDTTITGPSIRLAEALAQKWGSLLFGWDIIDQRKEQSTIIAYAWDLESNVRRSLSCIVRHERHTKKGSYLLTDPRDIYEVCANQAQRRVRSCILALIPGDLIEAAVEQCDKTLKEQGKNIPIADRAKKVVAAFADFGVTAAMIEARLHHTLATLNETELVGLRKIYTTIKDNQADPFSYFDRDDAPPDAAPKGKKGAAGLKDKLAEQPAPPAAQAVHAATIIAIDAAIDALGRLGVGHASAAMQAANPSGTQIEQMTEADAQRVLAALLAYKGA